MKIVPGNPVKILCAILYAHEEVLPEAEAFLERSFGLIDFRSAHWPFDATDYYARELGSPLWRTFVSFQELRPPEELARWKQLTNTLEDELGSGDRRRVNLDVGYLDYDKLVLASAKYNGQKIAVGHGIYADPTLHYEKGAFFPYPWAFPDFRDGRYDEALLEIRRIYKDGIKKTGIAETPVSALRASPRQQGD